MLDGIFILALCMLTSLELDFRARDLVLCPRVGFVQFIEAEDLYSSLLSKLVPQEYEKLLDPPLPLFFPLTYMPKFKLGP